MAFGRGCGFASGRLLGSDASDVVEKQLMPEDSDWMKHNRQALIVKSSAVRFGRTVSSISLSRKPLPQCPEPAGLDVTPRPFSRMKAIGLSTWLLPRSNQRLEGASMTWPWSLPFIGILVSIATGPLLFPKVWHDHYGKIAFGWAALALARLAIFNGTLPTLAAFVQSILREYLSFGRAGSPDASESAAWPFLALDEGADIAPPDERRGVRVLRHAMICLAQQVARPQRASPCIAVFAIESHA